MATTTNLLPAAQGNYSDWSNGAGSVPGNVQTNDGNTSYRSLAGSTTGNDTYTLDNLPAGAARVTAVVGHTVVQRQGAGGGTMKVRIRESATDADGTGYSPAASYADETETFATRPGGGPWTVAAINATEIGPIRTASGAAEVRCTQAFLAVTWTPGAAFVLFSVGIPAALQVFPFLEDFQGHAQAWLRSHPQHHVPAEDIPWWWNRHREYAYPAYFL